jgi:hypothetical protein
MKFKGRHGKFEQGCVLSESYTATDALPPILPACRQPLLSACVFVTRDAVRHPRRFFPPENLFVYRFVRDERRSWTEVPLYFTVQVCGPNYTNSAEFTTFVEAMVNPALPSRYLILRASFYPCNKQILFVWCTVHTSVLHIVWPDRLLCAIGILYRIFSVAIALPSYRQ